MGVKKEDDKEMIVCAAVRITFKDKDLNKKDCMWVNTATNFIYICGQNHGECFAKLPLLGIKAIEAKDLKETYVQGFLTNKQRFVDRKEALDIAYDANQLLPEDKFEPCDELLSEDINQYYGYGRGYVASEHTTSKGYKDFNYIATVVLAEGETSIDAITRIYKMLKLKPKTRDLVIIEAAPNFSFIHGFVYNGTWTELADNSVIKIPDKLRSVWTICKKPGEGLVNLIARGVRDKKIPKKPAVGDLLYVDCKDCGGDPIYMEFDGKDWLVTSADLLGGTRFDHDSSVTVG